MDYLLKEATALEKLPKEASFTKNQLSTFILQRERQRGGFYLCSTIQNDHSWKCTVRISETASN